jgi:hypothetical protein
MATHYKPDYRISYLSCFGLLGIILALLFLSRKEGSATGSVFHEVRYAPKEVVDGAIHHLTDSLHEAILQYRDKKITFLSQAGKSPGTAAPGVVDSIAYFAQHISQDSMSIGLLELDRFYYEDSTLTDSNALRIVTTWTNLGITPDMITQWDKDYLNTTDSAWRDSAKYYARLPLNNKLFVYKGVARFGITSYQSNTEFLAKYPGVAVWVFMIVMLCGFCFVVVPASIYIRTQVMHIFPEEERPGQRGYWIVTAVVAGSLLLFLEVLFHTFSDAPPVRDLFFMRTLTSFLNVANVVGCIAGGFCLAGFIHSSSMLGFFAERLRNQTSKVRKQREVVKTMMAPAPAGAPPPTAEAKEAIKCSDEQAVKHEEYADQFRKLLGFFHRYFILSAVLLSMVVLCTGALTNAVNSLTFIKLLTKNWGYSPAGGDAVYLFGGIFTAILLLVFLPAKMQFGDVQLDLPRDDQDKDDDNDSNWYSLLQQPFSWLKGGLIAATPFLSGLVQGLLGLFMKH